MTMQYRRDNKKKFFKKKTFIALGVVLLLVIFSFTPAGGLVSSGVYTVSTPLMHAGDVTKEAWTTRYSALFHEKETLVAENSDLKTQLAQVSARLLDRNLLFEENMKLREMLGRDMQNSVKVTARVLAGPSRTPYDTLLIDAGATSGVQVGDKVSSGASAIIGEVAEVYGSSAKIILYSSPGKQVDVFLGEDRVPATATGRGSGNFDIQIPRDIAVSLGGSIVIPGSDIRIAGNIERIDDDPNNPFKTILFKSPVNLYTLEWVDVLKAE